MTWLPTHDNVFAIHMDLVELFRHDEDPISPPGVKNQGLLESACNRPLTSVGSVEKYDSVFLKAAALFHSLTKNHAFHNGNKRTALVAVITMLHRNDYVLASHVTDEVIYDVTLGLTEGSFSERGSDVDTVVRDLAIWLRSNSERLDHTVPAMLRVEFAERCQRAGASVRPISGNKTVISTTHGTLKLSNRVRKFQGAVIRNYLGRLGLTQSRAGITSGEFSDGLGEERKQIHRYIVALRRLAKT